jgi:hypothetical protein
MELLDRGAGVNAIDGNNKTPLDRAEDEAIKNLLRSRGAKTGDELRLPKGWFPFWGN